MNMAAFVILIILPIILASVTAVHSDQFVVLLTPSKLWTEGGMTSTNLVKILLTVTLLVYLLAWLPWLVLVWKHRTMSSAEQISYQYIRSVPFVLQYKYHLMLPF